MPFYWRDWATSTRTLSAAAKGCYIDLLAHAWGAGSVPLDSEERRRITGVDRAEWRRVWPQLEPRWMEKDGALVNRRQEEVREKQALASKAGKASAEARAAAAGTAQPTTFRSNGIPNGTPNDARTECQQVPEPIRVQSTDNRKRRSPLPPKGAWKNDPQFVRFYRAYPNQVSPGVAYRAWLRIQPDEALVEQMLSAIAWQSTQPNWLRDEGQWIPHPSTWLNAEGWENTRPEADALPLAPYAPTAVETDW
jgi:uncharacterized protein YdaU (DUF1376 family)